MKNYIIRVVKWLCQQKEQMLDNVSNLITKTVRAISRWIKTLFSLDGLAFLFLLIAYIALQLS